MPRKLRVEYRTVESFRKEYAQNIAKGGVFVPSRRPVELREHVELELVLAFSDQSIVLPGEVVHCIPPEMAAESGAQPGVAVQILLDGEELRGKLEAFSGPLQASVDEQDQGTGRRIAPRLRAHVPAEVEIEGQWVSGHTRSVSRSGALIEIPGDPPELGQRVKVRIRLPQGRDQMKVVGRIARHVQTSQARCIGVQFQVPEAHAEDVADFVERVRAVEHSRRLGGINGPIATLGIRHVLGMFGGSTPEGMLTVTRGDEEGYILFERGMLRAQVGTSSGREALHELLSWTEGSFSFEGQVDETLILGDEIPMDELSGSAGAGGGAAELPAAPDDEDDDDDLALMDLEDFMEPEDDDPEPPRSNDEEGLQLGGADDDSMGELAFEVEVEFDDEDEDEDDEPERAPAPRISPDATLVVGRDPEGRSLGKTEEALLDLAVAGLTVAKAVEIIPESEDQVHAALENLIDEGLLTLA